MALSADQAATRERTLRSALLLSVWGPLATGIAVALGHSTTQLADFVRRSVELIALFVSWWVFRSLGRKSGVSEADRDRRERLAGLTVAAALVCSGIVMLVVALTRLGPYAPGGNVYLGLGIAILGLITNGWFWRRYAVLNRERRNVIISAQSRLYRAKAFVDLCVIAALGTVAVAPTQPMTQYIDGLGSIAVAGYMVWSGVRTAREHWQGSRLIAPMRVSSGVVKER